MNGQLRCFAALMKMDLAVFRTVLVDRIINFLSWAVTTTFVAGYVFPIFGMPADYGRFFFAGILASVGMFEAYGRIVELVTEMSDDKPIVYFATLPISSTLLVVRMIVSNALRFTILWLCIFPVGRMVLGSGFPLDTIHWPALLLICIVAHLFYGACSVLLACHVKSIMHISNVWTRIVFPVWFLGGLQFSQEALERAVPWLGIIGRLNPVMYITEAFRSAVLGAAGFTDIRLCLVMLTAATVIVTWRTVVAFRTRLDLPY